MTQILRVSSFGGGVVKLGSADAQRTDELELADSYDIGERGQLIVTSDISPWVDAITLIGLPLEPVYQIRILAASQSPRIVCVGDQAGHTYITFIAIDGLPSASADKGPTPPGGAIVTTAAFPTVDRQGTQLRLALVAIASRQAFDPVQGNGLYAVTYTVGSYESFGINQYDALGTGPLGSFPGGTKAKMLWPRGVLAYNGHALLWGYDSHDTVKGDGPNRVMFSNTGNPLKYGFDPKQQEILAGTAVETDRAFVDSDAVVIGGAGESIRAGLVWAGKAWFATSRGLHYMEGWGRESFLTNGGIVIRETKNVISSYAFIEGPDGLVHGVGDEGHWIFNGQDTDPVGDKLRNLEGESPGYWDLIWTDASRVLADFPGRTNSDLVWMLSDSAMKQVLIGIPFCNAATGKGVGADTVIIKYHPKTGGYTRQVFRNKTILNATEFRREQIAMEHTFFCGTKASLGRNVVKYRERAPTLPPPILPSTLPAAWHGEYAPHGADGVGVHKKVYLTLSWASELALPISFEITPVIDQKPVDAPIRLTIGDEPGPNLVLGPDTLGTPPWIAGPFASTIVTERAGVFAGRLFSQIDYLFDAGHATAGQVFQNILNPEGTGIFTLGFTLRHNNQLGRDIHQLQIDGGTIVVAVQSIYNSDGTITIGQMTGGVLTVTPLVQQAYKVKCTSLEVAAGSPLIVFASNISGAGYVDGVTSRFSGGWSVTGPPRDGDLWLDTSGTDTNLGLGSGGASVPANPNAYILRRYIASWGRWEPTTWGGPQGRRASIPIAFAPTKGTRIVHRVHCLSAFGRYQIEGLGLEPATIRSDR